VERVEETVDMARELEDRFGPLPRPAENLLYIVKIKVLAMRARVNSVSMQGRQIVIKPQTVDSTLKIRGAGGVMSEYPGAIKIGATQIKLDTRILGGKWTGVLEWILSCSCV
jgi:transcription-repair coupling factor (superfamily II helicase)